MARFLLEKTRLQDYRGLRTLGVPSHKAFQEVLQGSDGSIVEQFSAAAQAACVARTVHEIFPKNQRRMRR